jgi:hypothetical protein
MSITFLDFGQNLLQMDQVKSWPEMINGVKDAGPGFFQRDMPESDGEGGAATKPAPLSILTETMCPDVDENLRTNAFS